MIEDKIRAVLRTYRIGIEEVSVGIFIADTETDVTHDKVLRAAEVNLVMRDDDAHAGSRFSPVTAKQTVRGSSGYCFIAQRSDPSVAPSASSANVVT